MDFTLGIIQTKPPRASIQIAEWIAFTATQAELVDSVYHHLNSTSIRPNAKDLNVDGHQAVTLWWQEPGVITVHFTDGHLNIARSTAQSITAALQAEFVQVSDHFAELQRMIFDISDRAALIEWSDKRSEPSLAILEHATVHGGEFLYLHYIDPDTLSVSPLTRVSVHKIASVSPSRHLRCDL